MKLVSFLLVMASIYPATAHAQIHDPRILSLPAASSGPLRVLTAADVIQTFVFAPNERISSVVLSDPNAFFVVVSGTVDSLTIRGAKPGSHATMTVRTQMRDYDFNLMSGNSTDAPRVVRLVESPSSPRFSNPLLNSEPAQRHDYKLSGKRALRPSKIYDDGDKTFIEWSPEQALPATFANGPTGDEQMVDGYMRGGLYTIDRVYRELIFRIDRKKARAKRIEDKKDG